MSFKDEIDLLVRQNEALVKTLSLMGNRLDASLRQLSVISRLTEVPVLSSDMKSAASMVLEVIVRELTDINACSLLLYNADKDLLSLFAARGQADLLELPAENYHGTLAFKPGEGVAGKVFVDNEPIFWDREQPEPSPFKTDPEMDDPASLACLPLTVLGRPIGVLNISFVVIKPFDNVRRRDLVILSGVIANIIQSCLFRDITGTIDGKTETNAELDVSSFAHQSQPPEHSISELLQKRAILEQIVNSGPGIVFLWEKTISRKVEFVSDNISKLGYTPEEFYSDPGLYDSIIHPDDRWTIQEQMRKYEQSGDEEHLSMTYRMKDQNRHYKYVEERSTVKKDETGRVNWYYGVIIGAAD